MDRNSVIGLSLIGAILIVYTYINQPSAEQIKKQKERQELALKEKEESRKEAKESRAKKKKTIALTDVKTAQKEFKAETITLKSEDLTVALSSEGAQISSVYLNNYESYSNFAKNDGKTDALCLFKDGDQSNVLKFQVNGKPFSTRTLGFEVVSKSSNKVVFEKEIENGALRVTYRLKDNFDLDFTANFVDLQGVVKPENVVFVWDAALRKTERLLAEQRRVSTVCFQTEDGNMDYLSENASDEENPEQDLNWVAFKQSYFSAIVTPDQKFSKKGAKVAIRPFSDGNVLKNTHIKRYYAELPTPIKSAADGEVSLHFNFGPNDYERLVAFDKGYDDMLNFGWGLFRWINLYAVQPLFNVLKGSGIGIGIAILLLTIVLKLILMPVQWKMFISSAKMRILKPDIDAINAKYPKKEDAMKKQMDMMALYRESGASPLAGCVPMLFQMPILLAVFRFFPAAFELRQQSFLWAEDMSSYDSIWDFGINIPIYGDHMSLFTLLMAGTTLFYTWYNSSNVPQQQQPGMPDMRVIMYIFPFMMIFFFNNYASGLSYYYFISTLMTIIIMFVIKTFFVNEDKLKEKIALARAKSSTKSGGEKKKSKFMQRIEEAQRLQAEMKKNKK